VALELTWSPQPGDEKGSVTYKIGEDTAILNFDNPVVGFNKCSICGSILSAGTASNDCKVNSGQNAAFTYTLRSTK
jgi:hypothetical protein